MSFQAIFFDMDGLFLDSEPQWHEAETLMMRENGYDWNKPYRKSARVVGDVLGYLWTLAQDPVGELVTGLEWLSNGLARLVVTIGDTVQLSYVDQSHQELQDAEKTVFDVVSLM